MHMARFQIRCQRFCGRTCRSQPVIHPVQRQHDHADFQPAQLAAQSVIPALLFRLLLKRAKARFQFRNDIPDAGQVFLCVGQTPLRLLAAVAVFGDTRCFVKHLTAFLALDREDFVNLSLANHRVTVAPQAGIHK